MKRRSLSVLSVAIVFGTTTAAFAQQASITLTNCDAALCYHHENDWTLTKTADTSMLPLVTWTVTATKSSGATTFSVVGAVTVTNTGTADATIGNIVVNLQKPNNTKIGGKLVPWVSAAADMANATDGSAATSAKIAAAGSAESQAFNAAFGAGNYVVSTPTGTPPNAPNSQGTFMTTAGSGTVEFTDACSSTLFSLVPQPTIAPSASVTLLYNATFNVSAAGMPAPGTPIRIEAMVTFGNAGSRGGSGASAANIDINGNGVVDADEGPSPVKVRTVPCRVTIPGGIPASPEECNDAVNLVDVYPDDITTTGTVTTSVPAGFGSQDVNSSTVIMVGLVADPGASGGQVCNTAHLIGTTTTVVLNVLNPCTNEPVSFVCCEGVHLHASSCVDINAPPPGFCSCTYTKGGFGGGQGVPSQLFDNNFLTVFPGGLTIGTFGGNGTTLPNGATWTATTTGRSALKTYLTSAPSPGGNTALTTDTTNATSTSGGNLPKQTAALTLNVGFNDADGVSAPPGCTPLFGDLLLCNLDAVGGTSVIGTWNVTAAQAALLNGTSVRQVLADANTALSGAGLPAYVGSFGDLNQLVTALNESFDNCVVGAFATAHLCTS